jgi:hypothetical protein
LLEQTLESCFRVERSGDPQRVLERRAPGLLEPADGNDANARASRELVLSELPQQAQLSRALTQRAKLVAERRITIDHY